MIKLIVMIVMTTLFGLSDPYKGFSIIKRGYISDHAAMIQYVQVKNTNNKFNVIESIEYSDFKMLFIYETKKYTNTCEYYISHQLKTKVLTIFKNMETNEELVYECPGLDLASDFILCQQIVAKELHEK